MFGHILLQNFTLKINRDGAKICYVCIKIEIHFIAQDHSYTQELSIQCVSTDQCDQVCFSGGHFANLFISITFLYNIDNCFSG